MSDTLSRGADSQPFDVRLRVLGVAVLTVAAAGAIFSATPALDEPAPGTRCEDRQVATAWLSDRCVEDLFADQR
jgi:hypothetical protein